MRRLAVTLALGAALALPATAPADPVTVQGSPLLVSADGLGGLGVKFADRATGEFYSPSALIGHAGLELRDGTAVSIVSDGARRPVAGPTVSGATIQSTYVVALGQPLQVVETVTSPPGSRVVGLRYVFTNQGTGDLSFSAGELADLYVAGSDAGTGTLRAGPPRMIAGVAADGSVSGLLENTPWSHYQESDYSSVFNAFDVSGLTDTVEAASVDNGVGAQWDRTLGPGGSATINVAWSFAASGTQAAPPTLTASVAGATVTVGGTAEPGALVSVYDSGRLVGSVTAGNDGSWTLSFAAAPGAHVYTADATDAAGVRSGASAPQAVSVAGAPVPTPTPTPVPPPVPGKAVNVEVESGTVLLKLPGAKTFIKLGPGQQIPVGTVVDARGGRIGITSAADRNGKTATADFYDGLFKVTQTGGAKPITELTLVEALDCPASAGRASAAAKKPKTRRLWGDGKGSFRTRGHYSAATVRGTVWLVQDTCTTTLTRVKRGVVSVQDTVRHRTVVVKAGHTYTARKSRR